jgi:hypothetical protein
VEVSIYKSIVCVVFLASSFAVMAEDLSSCTLKTKPDEMNYCKASFAGSATFCDMIKNGEKKRECYFMVVKVQRKNAYQVPIPESKKVVEQP